MSLVAGAALAVLLIWSLLLVAASARERARLRRLARSTDIESFRRVAGSIPGPTRSISLDFADDLEAARPVEAALLDAMRAASSTRFAPHPALVAVRELVAVMLGCAPWVPTLLSVPIDVLNKVRQMSGQARPMVLLEALRAFEEPLNRLASAYLEGGMTLSALFLLWLLQGWLFHPSIREARWAGALLHASVALAPQASAAVAGRFAEALTPERGLFRPALAALACLLAVTLGWSNIYLSADARRARNAPLSISGWPSTQPPIVALPPPLHLPKVDGGTPIRAETSALAVGPETVAWGSQVLANLENARLPKGWEAEIERRLNQEAIELRGLTTMGVGAHRDIPLDTVLELLRFFEQHLKIRSFKLVMERRGLESSHRGYLKARFGEAPTDALHVVIDPSGAFPIDESADVRSPDALRSTVRTIVVKEGRLPTLSVKLSGELTWARLMSALGSADNTCPSSRGCLLPGLGIDIVFERE